MAHAQTLTPVVDVCSGIRLPRSAVTEIIGDVNDPILTSIEGSVNDILDLPLIGGVIPDLNVDLTTILANAAAGAPISVQLLDSNGNVVGPGDACNLSADGVALVQEAGISIGGNAITGLGANGQPASAGELDAIAFGNNATTAAGAAGAIALGTGASATAANSVALGAGSIADRGAQAGYTAPGVAGTFDSAGSVSVGSAGSLRQITNVAPGTAASDAATVGQVQGALDAIDAVADAAVRYDDATQATVTLAGTGGTTIANVADGVVSATSGEAVNGSQLFATNQAVATNTAAIAVLDTRVTANEADIVTLQGDVTTLQGGVTMLQGDISDLDSRVTVNEGDIAFIEAEFIDLDARVTLNSTVITAIDARVTTSETNIALLDASVTSIDSRVTTSETDIVVIQQQLANVPARFVSDADRSTPSGTPTNTVALASATGGPSVLTNVAAGTLSATSTDAVNGGQLYATNQQVAQNTVDIQNISISVAGSTVVAVQYSDPGAPTVSNGGTVTNDVTLVGANLANAVRVHNVADGTAANDAINVGQLQTALGSVMADTRTYVDSRIEEIGFDLVELGTDVRNLREAAFAGTAGAMAVAAIPQTLEVGRAVVGGGVGHYRGQTAFAIGGSSAIGDGRAVIKVGASIDQRGKGGVSAGAGFSF